MEAVKERTENQISLTEEVIDAAEYFSELGYQITPDFPETFFKCVSRMPKEEKEKRKSAIQYKDVFRALLAKNKDEFLSFNDDFSSFLERRRIVPEEDYEKIQKDNEKKQMKAVRSENDISDLKKQLKFQEQQLKEYQKLAESQSPVFTKEEIQKAEKKMKKAGKNLAKASGMSEKSLQSFLDEEASKNLNEEKIKKFKEKLKKGAAKAVLEPNYKRISELVKELTELADKAAERIHDNPASKAQALKQQCDQLKNAIRKKQTEAENYRREIQPVKVIKANSRIHRNMFIQGGNAIVSFSEGDKEAFKLLQKEFSKLNKKDFDRIRDYMRDHAQQFRTRISRNIRTSEKLKINFAETCKKACATNGVPINLVREKPKRENTSIVMILDVSGSCRSSSVVMLNFMQIVSEVFGGGVHSFVFVNSLYDITDAFADGESPEQVLSQIPTKGVYSDYYRPLVQFEKENMSVINKDTIVLFIGDARNNKNPTGEEQMKNICRRAKSAWFINTEEQSKWDKADSIISVYMPYMKKTAPVLSTADLLNFLMEVK